ncbi:DUF4259 domain-containing protein [Streptacidiphilus sp. EB103A]|uniref:DUF4259 domain-containing protein n=1 Tax=Streptacidiphilus sp. EB103A TaxID=3156275 RepID=UPI0035156BB3
MGTWNTGPFDNDTAADFAISLDQADADDREALVRGVLTRTVRTTGHVTEWEEAVAATALIAAQCPGGEPIASGHGPEEPMPSFAADLRPLATEALERIASDESGLTEAWVDSGDGREWLAMMNRLRLILTLPPPSHDIPLFDI